jgi:hypothetical protein
MYLLYQKKAKIDSILVNHWCTPMLVQIIKRFQSAHLTNYTTGHFFSTTWRLNNIYQCFTMISRLFQSPLICRWNIMLSYKGYWIVLEKNLSIVYWLRLKNFHLPLLYYCLIIVEPCRQNNTVLKSYSINE